MQQLASRPDQRINNGGAPRSQVILIVALLLFSLAGLASGFSVGAMSKTQKPSQSNGNTGIGAPITGQNATPTPQTAVRVTPLGCPHPLQNQSIYQADGATTYTFIAQAVDKTGDKNGCSFQTEQPVHAAGITSKIWLVKHIPAGKAFGFSNKDMDNILPHVNQLTQPLEGRVNDKDAQELPGMLQFNTPQVQTSDNQGQVTWHYKVNQGAPKGTYSLVLLVDWQGKAYNWSWFDFEITK